MSSETQTKSQAYNFQYSNMVLSIGGKILGVILLVMLVLFGTAPLSFPANAVRKMFNGAANSLASFNNSKK
jgi:Sec-independent protein translocase protein TatA